MTYNANKAFAESMKAAGIGGLSGKPTTSAAKKIQDRFIEQHQKQKRSEQQIDKKVGGLGSPSKPDTDDRNLDQKIYDGMKYYGAKFFGLDKPDPRDDDMFILDAYNSDPMFVIPPLPEVVATPLDPIENFGGEYGKKNYGYSYGDIRSYPKTDVSPTLPPSTINMFGVNTDNPRLNMFGVNRDFTKPPAAPELPTSPDVPANMDPLTRSLSQAMIPDPVVPTADYKTQAGDTLFSIQKTLKENGINTTVEEIAEINNIGLDGIFGIKPGTELKLPMPSTDAAPKEVKAALEKLTPTSMNEKKSFAEQLRDYTDYYKKLAAEAMGIGVQTDPDVIQDAVDNATVTITTDDTKENIAAYQNKLNSLGFSTGVADGAYGKNTANGIRRYQERNGLLITGTMNEETANKLNSGNSIVPTSIQAGNLTVSTAYRDDIDTSQLVISTDFNGSDNPKANGVEVVLPPAIFNAGPGNQHYDAAVKYIELVKDFFERKGYGEYKIRSSNVAGGQAGIKRSGGEQRGRDNTIHTEPFFSSDTKANNIVKANKEEFFDLYVQAFGNTTGAPLIAAHGKITEDNIVDKGAESDILGSEKSLADEGIKYIMKKYGNK